MPTAETKSSAAKSAARTRPAREKDRVDSFAHRHIGPNKAAGAAVLAELGFGEFDEVIGAPAPKKNRVDCPLNFPAAKSEGGALGEFRGPAQKKTAPTSLLSGRYS